MLNFIYYINDWFQDEVKLNQFGPMTPWKKGLILCVHFGRISSWLFTVFLWWSLISLTLIVL